MKEKKGNKFYDLWECKDPLKGRQFPYLEINE